MKPFEPGDIVECLEASNGAHCLERGRRYTVASTQTDEQGRLRLNLVGMARAWEAERFRLWAGHVPRPYATEPPEPPDALELVEILRMELAYVRGERDALEAWLRQGAEIVRGLHPQPDSPAAQWLQRVAGERLPGQTSQAKETP